MTRYFLRARPARVAAAALGLSFVATLEVAAQSLTIPTVVVGNPGNLADPSDGDAFAPGVQNLGAVANTYHIGKHEVTNAEYVEFLNAVAATDSFNLFSFAMTSVDEGGITRTGSSGSYVYSVKPGYASMPVVYVSFWDAARFSNWLATGYTEGRVDPTSPLLPGAAYDTNFVVSPDFAAGNRLSGASVFVPSEDEWYKAAYFQPAAAGGDTDNYWLYATGSNVQPTSATPGPGADRANYYYNDSIDNGINGGYAVTQSTFFPSGNALTDVGAYGAGSESYYGTADQNGNVAEWNDSAIGSSARGVRGGSWNSSSGFLQSSIRDSYAPTLESNLIGFRVASLAPIPEPGTYAALAGAAALAALLWRRRTRGGL